MLFLTIASTEHESGDSVLIVRGANKGPFSEMGEVETGDNSRMSGLQSWSFVEQSLNEDEFSLSRMPSKMESRVSKPTTPTSGIKMSISSKESDDRNPDDRQFTHDTFRELHYFLMIEQLPYKQKIIEMVKILKENV